MTLLSKSITIIALYCLCVKCDNIESNESKTGDRSESVGEFGHKTNPHSQQSSLMPNENGYNNHQNSYDQSFVQESNNAQTDSSGDQNNGQSDKKVQKTLILAIPVKLAIQSPGQQNYESDSQQPVVQSTHSTYHSISNNNNPYNLAKYSILSNVNSHQPSAISGTSQPNDSNVNSQLTRDVSQQQQQQQQSFKPQSKTFTSINSKLKSATYSTAHPIPHSNYHSNGKQYKTAYDLNHDNYEDKDYKYAKNNNYRSNQRDEYKTETNRGVDDYGSNKYKNTYNRHNEDIKFDDSNEDKSIFNMKESAKSLYDSDSKFEYDYDSDTDSEHPFDEYDNTRVEDNYHNKHNHKTGHYSSSISNDRNNRYKGKSIAFEEKPHFINHHNYYSENGHSYGPSNNQDSDDGWLNDNYDIIKPNANNWPQIYETMDGNGFTSLSRGLNGRQSHAISNKEIGGNAYYTPVSELFAESHIKPALAPLGKSKIYGSPSNYQPLSLFAGFGRDYGSVNINGDLYPAALVANHPPRKLYKTSIQDNNKFLNFRPLMNHQFMPPRNPIAMRPSFTPGFRASKPLANYSPFASASTTSFLSSFPNGFTVKKSFPRHIFPALYG